MKETLQGRWGYVIRDEDGDVLLAGAGKINDEMEAWQAELTACIQGANVAMQCGMGRIIFETDAVLVQQAVKSQTFRLSTMGASP